MNNPNNFNVNTNRFIDVTTPRQMSNGTVMFMDSANPGVYYTTHRNGNVNRVIKTTEKVIKVGANNSIIENAREKTTTTRINFRYPNSTKYLPLFRLNDQRRRIQHVGENYSRNLSYTTNENGNVIMVNPR